MLRVLLNFNLLDSQTFKSETFPLSTTKLSLRDRFIVAPRAKIDPILVKRSSSEETRESNRMLEILQWINSNESTREPLQSLFSLSHSGEICVLLDILALVTCGSKWRSKFQRYQNSRIQVKRVRVLSSRSK